MNKRENDQKRVEEMTQQEIDRMIEEGRKRVDELNAERTARAPRKTKRRDAQGRYLPDSPYHVRMSY